MRFLCRTLLLKAFKTLTFIDLSQNQMDAEGVSALAQVIANNPSLTFLSLESCGLGVDETATVISSLERRSELTSLNLAANVISPSGIASLSSVFSSASKKLTSLNLASTGLKIEGVKALAQALVNFRSVSDGPRLSLNLAHNDIGDEGVKALDKSHSKYLWQGGGLPDLFSMQLDDNQISPQGILTLCSLMIKNMRVRNTPLKLISLSNNPIGDEGIVYLSKLLFCQSSLTALYLNHIGIGDAGVRLIAQALSSKSSLTDISLKFNDAITEVGIAALRKALTLHPFLPPSVLRDVAHKESYFD